MVLAIDKKVIPNIAPARIPLKEKNRILKKRHLPHQKDQDTLAQIEEILYYSK